MHVCACVRVLNYVNKIVLLYAQIIYKNTTRKTKFTVQYAHICKW